LLLVLYPLAIKLHLLQLRVGVLVVLEATLQVGVNGILVVAVVMQKQPLF
jgi:hypothetical protein